MQHLGGADGARDDAAGSPALSTDVAATVGVSPDGVSPDGVSPDGVPPAVTIDGPEIPPEQPTASGDAPDASAATPVDPVAPPVSTPMDAVPACTLGTATDCAACGDPACTLANTGLACTSADGCARAVCAAGFGNCELSSPDCETSFAAGGVCLPSYRGTTAFPTTYVYASSTTIGTDGSFFLSGAFQGTLDFDPTDAVDLHSAAGPTDHAVFITKFNSDGSYAWTRSLPEPTIALGLALAAAAGGAIVAVGDFSGSVDLDPGSGVDQHVAGSGRQVLVFKLAADGSFVWGRSFEGTDERSFSSTVAVAVDPTDAVYVAGGFTSSVDFDPGPGAALRTTSSTQAGMLVKLTAAGDFSWVQTIDEPACASSLRGVAVATDGTVWAAGATCQAVIAAFGGGGAARGVWRLPDSDSYTSATAVAAGADGSVYVGGQASGLVNLDPGGGVTMRWVAGFPGGFLLKLAPDASLLWAQALPDLLLNGLASTEEGGVVAVGWGLVANVGPDGTARWTFATGSGGELEAVAARGGSFAVAGGMGTSDSADFDPGPGTQVLAGPIRFLSRFDF